MDHNKLWKILKRWEYLTTLPASWETCIQYKKQQLEPDIEQQIVSELGKEYVKAVYCHPAYLTSMQSTSCEMPRWRNHKLESRLPGEISNNLRYADDNTLMAESEEDPKEPLVEGESDESEKAVLKLSIQ